MQHRLSGLGRIASILALGATALVADGSQTGTVTGTIRDASGKAVAGARVRIEGPNLQGGRTATSNAAGEYRLLLLPPGSYSLTANADGFAPVRVNVVASINDVTKVNIPLSPMGGITVVVTASASSLDTSSVTSENRVTREDVDRLPVGRTYQGMMALAPGVTGGANPNVLGGRSSENVYLVDGVDTTDPTTGTFGLNLAEDSIEEVQILTTGISAEFGRFNGAVANVVTKGGSNTFEGHARYAFSNVKWNATAPMGTKQASNLVKTPYVTVGGPIIKDRLWYFISLQKPETSRTDSIPGPWNGAGIQYDRIFEADPVWYSAKLTYAINENHTVVLQRTGDPAVINHVQYGAPTTLDTTTEQAQGGDFTSLSYRGILASNITLEAKLAQQTSEITVKGNGGSKIAFYDQINGRQYENGPFEGYVKRPRNQANVALTWYLDAAGTHEIRTGLDSQTTKSKNKFGSIGDREVYFSGFTGTAAVFGSNGWNYNMDPNFDSLYIYTPTEESTSEQKYSALYVNDRWKLNNHWNFSIGFRFEKIAGDNDIGERIFDYNTFVPRLGVTYDLGGDGKSSIGAFYGEYYQSPWQDSLDGLGRLTQGYDGYGYISGDPHLRSSFDSTPFDTSRPAADGRLRFAKDLKGSKTEETTFVYKQQITPQTSFQAVAVYKEFQNQLDTRVYYALEGGAYTRITNLQNATNSRRRYGGLLLSMEHRGDKWFFAGNWTISRLYGNHDSDSQTSSFNNFTSGTYQPLDSTGNSWNTNNATGLLSTDRTHVLKAFAARRMTWGNFSWDHGFRATYFTGLPYNLSATRRDTSVAAYIPAANADRSFTYIMGNARGQHRFHDTWSVDYTATWNYAISKRFQTYLRMDVTNVLNHQMQGTWNTSMTYVNATNPLTEGSFRQGAQFGKPTGSGNFITPRTLGFSLGFKF